MIKRVALLGLFLHVASLSAQDIRDTYGSTPADVIDEMVVAAETLLSTLDDPARQSREEMLDIRTDHLRLTMEDENRQDWSYWPRSQHGMLLSLMNTEQRILVHELLSTLLGIKGQLKVTQIMELDNVLEDLEFVGQPRGFENYYLTIFGSPSATTPWSWRFQGHHLSLNVTLIAGDIAVTPSFLGATPAEISTGFMAGLRTLRAEEDLGRLLARSFNAAQIKQAKVGEQAPRDLFTGNLDANAFRLKDRRDWDTWRETVQPEGIAVADLDTDQRIIVQRIVDEVITTYRPEIANGYLEGIDITNLSFAWMGSLERRSPHYYRLQGGDFVFEYDNFQGNGNHIHTVWRSVSGDFGEDLLESHYRESHR